LRARLVASVHDHFGSRSSAASIRSPLDAARW
jgi:hypothetical protein